MQSINIISIIMHSLFLVKASLVVLTFMSIKSWATIIQNHIEIKQKKSDIEKLNKEFWYGSNLNSVYKKIDSKIKEDMLDIEHIYISTVNACKNKEISKKEEIDIIINKYVSKLENSILPLANIGSISPYIGLFGTICGIIHTFLIFSAKNNINIKAIAPGISESLIATAAGLIVAIPAISYYNKQLTKINKIEQSYKDFSYEITTVIKKNEKKQNNSGN